MSSQNPTQKSATETLRANLARNSSEAAQSLKTASDSAMRNIRYLPHAPTAQTVTGHTDEKVLQTFHRAIERNETPKFIKQLRDADPAQRQSAINDALNYVAAVGGTSFESLCETLTPPAQVTTPAEQARWEISQFASRMRHLSTISSEIQTYDRNASDAMRAVIYDRIATDLDGLVAKVAPFCIDDKSVTTMFDNIRKCMRLPFDPRTSTNLRAILDHQIFAHAVTQVADLSNASDEQVMQRIKVASAIIHQSGLAAGVGSMRPRNEQLMREALADDIAKGIANMADPDLQRDAITLAMSDTTTRPAYREAFAKVGIEVPNGRQLMHSASIGISPPSR